MKKNLNICGRSTIREVYGVFFFASELGLHYSKVIKFN